MAIQKKKVERFTDAARIFTLLVLVALCYLAIGTTRGLKNPEKRAELANQLLDFDIPEGYRLSAAVHMAVSRFAVLWNESHDQRIKISENRLGGVRRPDDFRRMYFRVGKTVRRYRNLGGFDRIVIEATGEMNIAGHVCPFVGGRLEPGGQEGEVFLLFCAPLGRSYTIVATAPAGMYEHEETRAWLKTIRCHAP
jgi:hypothetical protein